jgi:hypothetical protein
LEDKMGLARMYNSILNNQCRVALVINYLFSFIIIVPSFKSLFGRDGLIFSGANPTPKTHLFHLNYTSMKLHAIRNRPTGVRILGILGIVGGSISIIFGIGMAVIGSIGSQFSETDIFDTSELDLPDGNSTDNATVYNKVKKIFESFFILGIILIPYGIAGIIVSWFFLNGKRWAWIGAVIYTIISIIITIFIIVSLTLTTDDSSIGGNIVSFGISGVILWYLYRPNVRLYFG